MCLFCRWWKKDAGLGQVSFQFQMLEVLRGLQHVVNSIEEKVDKLTADQNALDAAVVDLTTAVKANLDAGAVILAALAAAVEALKNAVPADFTAEVAAVEAQVQLLQQNTAVLSAAVTPTPAPEPTPEPTPEA